jgi:hypothetical protein
LIFYLKVKGKIYQQEKTMTAQTTTVSKLKRMQTGSMYKRQFIMQSYKNPDNKRRLKNIK